MTEVLYIGVSFAVFTAVFFLTKRPRVPADAIVIFFMLFLMMPMLHRLAAPAVIFGYSIEFIFFMEAPFTFGPFLYLYAGMITDPAARFKKSYMLHFIPFLIFGILALLTFPGHNPHSSRFAPHHDRVAGMHADGRYGEFHAMPDSSVRHGMPGRPFPDGGPERRIDRPLAPSPSMDGGLFGPGTIWGKIKIGALIFSFVLYTCLVIIMLRRHRRRIPDYYSYDSLGVNLQWLEWIMISFIIAYTFVLSTIKLYPLYLAYFSFDERLTPDIGTTFFIVAFSFFAIKQPIIYPDPSGQEGNASIRFDDDSDIGGFCEKSVQKYRRSGLKDEEAEAILERLQLFMMMQKPYLNADMTIYDLSAALSISKHYLTQIINEKLNQNFYMYVNGYRIREVLEKMADEKYVEYPILNIAFESGFNSKSTFNAVFKKLMNLTPSEYRSRSLKSSAKAS